MDQQPYWQHSTSRHGERSTIALAGELDVAAAPQVQRLLLAEVGSPQVRAVRVDLSAATYLDSALLTALVAGYRAAQSAGRGFWLVEPSPGVRKVLEVTGLLELMGREPPGAGAGAPGR